MTAQPGIVAAARAFMDLFVKGSGPELSAHDVDHQELAQRYDALSNAIATTSRQPIGWIDRPALQDLFACRAVTLFPAPLTRDAIALYTHAPMASSDDGAPRT